MNGFQRGAQALYRYLVALVALGCVVQIFLAGRGVFGIKQGVSFDDQKSLDPHRAVGEIIGLVTILVFLSALAMWKNKRLIGYAFALAFMAEILQHALAQHKHPWVAGLHAVDGVGILALSAWLAHQAWRGEKPSTA